jgi:conflict system pore-forming effector with SLATT domain
MFQLSIVDHIRLSFGTVVGAYQGHTAAALRLSRWGWYSKIAALSLLGAGTGAGLLALRHGPAFGIAAVVMSALAFAGLAVHMAFDPTPRIYGHRACAARLWLLCEKYRALLTEVQDELVDVAGIASRRDALLHEFSALLELAPPDDRETYQIAQRALSGPHLGGYTDHDLDQFLPAALRRSSGSAEPIPQPAS